MSHTFLNGAHTLYGSPPHLPRCPFEEESPPPLQEYAASSQMWTEVCKRHEKPARDSEEHWGLFWGCWYPSSIPLMIDCSQILFHVGSEWVWAQADGSTPCLHPDTESGQKILNCMWGLHSAMKLTGWPSASLSLFRSQPHCRVHNDATMPHWVPWREGGTEKCR